MITFCTSISSPGWSWEQAVVAHVELISSPATRTRRPSTPAAAFTPIGPLVTPPTAAAWGVHDPDSAVRGSPQPDQRAAVTIREVRLDREGLTQRTDGGIRASVVVVEVVFPDTRTGIRAKVFIRAVNVRTGGVAELGEQPNVLDGIVEVPLPQWGCGGVPKPKGSTRRGTPEQGGFHRDHLSGGLVEVGNAQSMNPDTVALELAGT